MRPSEEGRPRTSDLLEGLARQHPGPAVTLQEVADALGERGFGVLIFLLAVPNALPGPPIPGFSAVFAIPLALLAAQVMAGRDEPWLPRRLMRRSFPVDRFRRMVGHATPRMRRIEKFLRPRPGLPDRRLLGAALLALILAMALPIPLVNLPPAAVICVVALGMVEKDGRAVRLGLVLGACAIAWVVAVTFGGAQLVRGWF